MLEEKSARDQEDNERVMAAPKSLLPRQVPFLACSFRGVIASSSVKGYFSSLIINLSDAGLQTLHGENIIADIHREGETEAVRYALFAVCGRAHRTEKTGHL